MIDYKDIMTVTTTAQDAACKACIIAPPSVMPETAKALATIINEFGVAGGRLYRNKAHDCDVVPIVDHTLHVTD